LLIGGIFASAYLTLPSDFQMFLAATNTPNGIKLDIISNRKPYHAAVCSIFGLVSGMIIGLFTEYMTSHTYGPVR